MNPNFIITRLLVMANSDVFLFIHALRPLQKAINIIIEEIVSMLVATSASLLLDGDDSVPHNDISPINPQKIDGIYIAQCNLARYTMTSLVIRLLSM